MSKSKESDIAPNQPTISYEIYSTDQDEFQIWVDVIFKKLKLPIPIVSTIIGLLVYFGGLFIALLIGFEKEYIHTRILYIGAFGISYVLYMIRSFCLKFHHAVEKLRPCFLMDDETYREKINKWFSLMSNKWYHIITSAILFLMAICVVYIAFYRPDIIQNLNLNSFRPSIIENFWYDEENLLVKMLIFIYYALSIAPLFGTSLIILILLTLFVRTFNKFAIVPLPNLVRFRLRELTNLYVLVSLAWFIGVGFFGLALFDSLDTFSVTFLLIIGFAGWMTFFTPQFVYRKLLMSSYDLSCKLALSSYYDTFNIHLIERKSNNNETDDKVYAGEKLADLITSTEEVSFWVYNLADIAIWLLGQALMLGGVYLESWLS